MRKRIRKKRHLEEFAERGFTLYIEFEVGADEDLEIHDAVMDFLESCQPKLTIEFGSGHKNNWSFVVRRYDKYASTYDGDRAKVFNWCRDNPKLLAAKISHSFDLWHSDFVTDDDVENWDEQFCLTKESS
jgi:uncharacterized protein YggL (DUF469 family)